MLDADFIEKIIDINRTHIIFQNNERQLSTGKLFPVLNAEVSPLRVHTLTGLVDLFPTINQNDAIIHIYDFNKVSLVSQIFGPEKQRDTFIYSEAYDISHDFGNYLNQEDFIIFLLSHFVQDDTTATILKIVGNLRSEASGTFSDDGVSQTVSAKTGITKVENIDLPNPVELRPFRTFADIEQPASKFVLRLKQGDSGAPKIALYEADGGAWKNTAIATIKAFFAEHLPHVQVVA